MAKYTLNLDTVEKLAHGTVNTWSPYRRSGDYVNFGPVDSHKDNMEGDESAYKLVGYLNPERVLELVRLAKIGKEYDDR